MAKKREIMVVLNNVRSNENVGSIFRTADAAGVSKIILCGYTPAPTDKFGRPNKGIAKAALGAEKFVAWEKTESFKKYLKVLKNFSSKYSKKCLASLTEASTRNFLARKYPCIFENTSKKNFCKNFTIIAIEQDKNSVDYKKIKKLIPKDKNLILVFGNEVEGLSKKDLALCDLIAEIPMLGKKESLNVSVSAGIVLFSLF